MIFDVEQLTDVPLYVPPDTEKFKRLFFDIEGSLTKQGDVIQLAYILTDWDFNILKSYCKYYLNSSPILDVEFEKHRLSESFLWSTAEHHFSVELVNLDVFYNTDIMYITYSSFDINKMTEQCRKYNLPEIDFGNVAISLKTHPKPSNQFNAQTIHGDTQRLIQVTSKEQKSEVAAVTQSRAHDAMYDTYLTYVLCRDYYNKMP